MFNNLTEMKTHMNDSEKYFIVINGISKNINFGSYVWNDIANDITIKSEVSNLTDPLLKKMLKAHFSNKLNRIIYLPFKGIWDNFFSIQPNELCSGKNYIIFQTGVKYSPTYIKKLKENYNTKIILYMPDTIENIGIANDKCSFEKYKKYYQIDRCFSFDPDDCKKYDMEFFDFYSFIKTDGLSAESTDLLYIGNYRNYERIEILKDVINAIKGKLNYKIRLNSVPKNKMKECVGMEVNKPMEYRNIVAYSKKTKCILEIINNGQKGNTLRFKEAVCYNKKLLTNNEAVIHSKYYDPKFIQVFRDVNEIDWEWIKKDVIVDYGYDGEFSPRNLLEAIKR